jgi:hypothetical protein
MAEHLASIVRSATAAKAGAPWETALPCGRRPGNRPCHGHVAVFRADLPAPIEWRCTVCEDEGVISGWEGSFFDLRQLGSHRVDATLVTEVPISYEVCAALRDLRLLDGDCELLVLRARAAGDCAVLSCSAEDLDGLIGYVAAEANHETNRRRQKRLDLAFAVLSDLLDAMEP